MPVFYHVSTCIHHSGTFEPRIPLHRHQGAEDNQTPRCSVAPTIEDCLTAIPDGGGRLEELNIKQRGVYLIFRIDTEELGIEEKDIIKPDYLYKKDLVRDAEITKEHWITTKFEVPEKDRFLIKLISWDETVHDIVPHSLYQVAEESYDGDYFEAYRDIYKEYMPSSIAIREPIYIHEEAEEGQEIELYFDDTEEKKLVEAFLLKNNQVEIKRSSYFDLSFVMKNKGNLAPIFHYEKNLSTNQGDL